MGGLGKAVSNAVISGRRETTKSMRKTPSIGHDIAGWEVHEVQIPGTQIEPQRPFLDTLLPECCKTSSSLQVVGRNYKPPFRTTHVSLSNFGVSIQSPL
jgi:hypothetical protein